MPITRYSAREFNQDVNGAKKAAAGGPVIITHRGTPAHVLLTHAEYLKLKQKPVSAADALAMRGAGDSDFAPGKKERRDKPRAADLG